MTGIEAETRKNFFVRPEPVLSPAEKLAELERLVAYCKRLKEEGKITPSMHFYVNNDGLIEAKPLPPTEAKIPGVATLEQFEKSCARVARAVQGARSLISGTVEVPAEQWKQTIAMRALMDIENGLFQQVKKIKNYQAGGEDFYHIPLISFYGDWLKRLYRHIDSPLYRLAGGRGGLGSLNKFGERYFKDIAGRRMRYSLSDDASLVLCVDALRAQTGKKQGNIETLMAAFVDARLLEKMEIAFRNSIYPR